ncbi:MAG: sulfur carrier protein ThiS [Acidobacteriota bacterium]|nr:sulfur carrier protein ThiS [Acidobacteriota bacterium]
MTVRVNGSELEMPEGASVATVLERLEIGTPRVAVERNREIVPKSEYSTTCLTAGDVLEVVEFVGGG